MNFTSNPLEREMKRRPRPRAPRPEQPREGSRCCGCPYWRGIPCGSCLISGAVIIEKIFGLPGMGNLLLNSIIVQDMPVVQAVLLLIAILTVICNLLSDIIMGILDPRIRLSLSGGDN